MEIQNPHDKFFKETFGNVDIAQDFLNNYLPQHIIDIMDIETLEPQKDSFIDKELKEVFSDLLFKVNINGREGYIYFLFEHKSYISENIALQLLKYMIAIWETKKNKEKANKLPMIIPLVIYHGKDQWNIKNTLGSMINGFEDVSKDIQKLIPDYEYLIYDLSMYTDEEIKGRAQLRIALTMLRDIFTKDDDDFMRSIFRSIKYLQELEDEETGIEYFETLVRYIFSAKPNLTNKDFNNTIRKMENTYPEGSEVVMTLREVFIEEGMQQGIQEGERKKGLHYAMRLLTKKFGKLPKEYKTRLRNADTETLDLIIDDIFALETLGDIDKYL